MPKDSEGSTGSSYIVDRKNRKVLIPIDVNKIEDIKKVLGTLTEEVAHGKDALEGRQDKKVAEDKSNDEKGLESLGRPANEYVKKKFGEDNNSKIKLTTDGIDLSNADVGEKVGDVLLKSEIDAAGGVGKVLTPTTNEKIFKVVRLKSNQEVAVEFFQGVTNKSLWSTIYDATPILGDIKGIHDGLTGKDSITGEKLSFFDRFIGGLPLIGRSVDTFQTINKPMKKGMDSLINLIIDFSKGSSKINNVNDTTKLVRITEGIGDSSGVTKAVVKEIKVVDNSADITKASKNLEKATDVSEDITKAVAKEVKVIDNSSDTGKIAKNTNPSNQRERVSQSNKNNTNNLKVEGRNSTNQRVNNGTVDTTQKVVSTVSNNNKVGKLIFYAEENGYEVYYRTMSLKNYESFKKTGKIPATGETTISPTQAFSEGYDGVLVKFKVKKGTTDKLIDIGVRDESSILADKFPNMPKSKDGWGKNHARFKKEDEQLNIGLGKGKGLDIFNENIVEVDIINMNNKKEVNKK